MTARQFLRTHMAVIDEVYLDHEGSLVDSAGIVACHCGYRSTEAEWLVHVADKIADRLEVESVVELPFEVAS